MNTYAPPPDYNDSFRAWKPSASIEADKDRVDRLLYTPLSSVVADSNRPLTATNMDR